MGLGADGRDVAVAWPRVLFGRPDAVTLTRREPISGSLAEAGCFTPTGAGGCAALAILGGDDVVTDVAFAAGGSLVIIETTSGLATFARDAVTNQLTLRQCSMWERRLAPCGSLPEASFGMALSPDERSLFLMSFGPAETDDEPVGGRVVALDLAPAGRSPTRAATRSAPPPGAPRRQGCSACARPRYRPTGATCTCSPRDPGPIPAARRAYRGGG